MTKHIRCHVHHYLVSNIKFFGLKTTITSTIGVDFLFIRYGSDRIPFNPRLVLI